MKKLLSILGVVAFTASVSSTVVACGSTSSKSSSKQKDGIDWGNDNEVLITLADGTKVRLGDFLGKQSSLDDYLLNDVNELVGNRYTEDYNSNTLNGSSNLGFLDLNRTYSLQNSKTKVNAYSNEIKNFGMISSATDLYRQYIAALINGWSLDQQYIRQGDLNPVWYGTDHDLKGKYSLWFQVRNDDGTYTNDLKRWTTISETDLSKTNNATKDGSSYSDVLGNKFLPTAEELNGNKFFLLDDSNLNKHTGTGSSLINKDDTIKVALNNGEIDKSQFAKIVASNISGQQALLLRYQSYVQSTNNDSMINALVMEYAKNNLYKMQSKPKDSSLATDIEKANNKSLYIDSSSTIAKDIQSWPSKDSDLVSSNYKMVWTLTLPKADSANIQTAIQSLINLSPVNPKLKSSDYSLIKTPSDATKDGILKDTIKQIIDGAKDTKVTDNLSQNGQDPYWNIKGYQGIVNNGKLVSGGSLDIDSGAVDKIKSVEGLGIISNGTTTAGSNAYSFSNKTHPNDYDDYVFVMPLYLMDLLRDGTGSKAPDDGMTYDDANLNNIAHNQWIELNPQVANASWTSASKFAGIDLFKGTNDALPTKPSLLSKDNKWYVFIPDGYTDDIALTVGGKSLTVHPSKDTSATDLSGYGVKGIYETSDKSKKDAWKYNGQSVNYKIHLGSDNSNPDSYQNAWTTAQQEQNINDVAQLSNTQKDDLMNSLFASVAKNDSTIQEETKNAIYRNYISLDDIFYKGLYDKISKYLKTDDKTDPTD